MTPLPARRRPPDWTRGAALVLLAFGVYVPSLGNQFLWDDKEYLLENRLLWEPGGLRRIWFSPLESQDYYPMVFTGYWLERRLWGYHPAGYHAVNALLYGLGAAALWVVFLRMGLPFAWTAAAAFALHPIHAESAGWITERKDVLMGAFGFGAVAAWLSHLAKPSSARAALCLALFACALLSKTVACTIAPALVLISLRDLRAPGAKRRGRWGLAAVMFLLAGAAGLATAWWQSEKLGAKGDDYFFTTADRVLIAGRAFWFYLGKIIWPNGSSLIYPRWPVGYSGPVSALFPATALASVSGLLMIRSRAPAVKAARLAVLLYIVLLAPAMGFVNFTTMKYSFAADHYQFLAGTPVIALLASAWAGLLAGKPGAAVSGNPKRLAAPGIAAAAFGLSLGMILTIRAQAPLADLETSWRHALRRNPESPAARHGLAGALQKEGRKLEALDAYERLFEIEPDHLEGLVNAGSLQAESGDFAGAESKFNRALELAPDYAKAHAGRGLALSRAGRLEEAITSHRRALELDPDLPGALMNLGADLAGLGRFGEAEPALRRAAELRPLAAEPWVNLGVMLAQTERWAEAVAAFERAAAIKPSDPGIRDFLAEARRREVAARAGGASAPGEP